MRSDEFWDGAFVDMGIERGLWYAALVTVHSRTVRVHPPSAIITSTNFLSPLLKLNS